MHRHGWSLERSDPAESEFGWGIRFWFLTVVEESWGGVQYFIIYRNQWKLGKAFDCGTRRLCFSTVLKNTGQIISIIQHSKFPAR